MLRFLSLSPLIWLGEISYSLYIFQKIPLVVQTRRLLQGRPASRLLRFARNDSVRACHCEEHSDEAISVKVRTGGNHLSDLHH